jgi:hypothetical protein
MRCVLSSDDADLRLRAAGGQAALALEGVVRDDLLDCGRVSMERVDGDEADVLDMTAVLAGGPWVKPESPLVPALIRQPAVLWASDGHVQ